MNNSPKYALFVSSSDAYSDIWPMFFDHLQKFWPSLNAHIYLNTEEKSYTHSGLSVTCTQVGKHKHFGETFLAGLNQVEEDTVLLIMIDYLLMGAVDTARVEQALRLFQEQDFDTVCLWGQPFSHWHPIAGTEYAVPQKPYPGSVLFGFQAAFWKKSVLHEMVLPHENPWMAEWYGSMRAERMAIRYACLARGTQSPLPYDVRGCLHQGRWLDNAVAFLQEEGYEGIDFTKRGIYDDATGYNSLRCRISTKWTIWKTGLCGSWQDLRKRKPIH